MVSTFSFSALYFNVTLHSPLVFHFHPVSIACTEAHSFTSFTSYINTYSSVIAVMYFASSNFLALINELYFSVGAISTVLTCYLRLWFILVFTLSLVVVPVGI